jgi:hypothetical protein
MAEYWIIGVDHERTTASRGPIVKVLYTVPKELNKTWDTFDTGFEATRAEVLDWLKRGQHVLYTAKRDSKYARMWDRGDLVEPTRDKLYITTKGNATTEDNLGKLPSIVDARADLRST